MVLQVLLPGCLRSAFEPFLKDRFAEFGQGMQSIRRLRDLEQVLLEDQLARGNHALLWDVCF
jgi:hypothetical protein